MRNSLGSFRNYRQLGTVQGAPRAQGLATTPCTQAGHWEVSPTSSGAAEA